MEIQERIPDLSDKELESFHANALRLAQSGTPMQRQRAEEALPLLAAALDERRQTRSAATSQVRRANVAKRAAAKKPKLA